MEISRFCLSLRSLKCPKQGKTPLSRVLTLLQKESIYLMPSAHRPIFCRTELWEKVRVKVWFFIGVSQHTRTDFLTQAKHRTYLTISYWSVICRTRPNFLSELLCVTMAGEVPALDYVTPIFYRTEVSAHGPIFCHKQLREKIGLILYRTKIQHTWTDFHSNFLSTTTKNPSVCAGHNRAANDHHILHATLSLSSMK